MASRLIFMTIFLLSPVFSKKYENLSWKSITTSAQKKIQQEKSKDLNLNEIQEKLDKNFFSIPLVKKTRGRPRINPLSNLKSIPSQTKKREVDQETNIVKWITRNKYAKRKPNKSRIRFRLWSWLFRLVETNSSENKKKKNAKKPKNINGFGSEEIENYFLTSEDEVIDIKTEDEVIDIETEDEKKTLKSCIGKIFENKNIEDTVTS